MSNKYELHASADPTVTRIIPELAKEIGLNESIVLLQIAYWIKAGNNEQDGEFWTYQSVRDMEEKAFGYWSVDTIARTVNKLLKEGYLKSRDDLNQRKGDKTRWFALNIEGLRKLASISVREMPSKPVRKSDRVSENKTPTPQDQTADPQNRTTLPKTPTETPTESLKTGNALPPAYAEMVDGISDRQTIQPIDNDTAAQMQGSMIIQAYEAMHRGYNAPQVVKMTLANRRIAAEIGKEYSLDELRAVLRDALERGDVVPFNFLQERLGKARLKPHSSPPSHKPAVMSIASVPSTSVGAPRIRRESHV